MPNALLDPSDLPMSLPASFFGMGNGNTGGGPDGGSAWPMIAVGAIQRLGGAFSQAGAIAASSAYTAAQSRTNAQLAKMQEHQALFAGDWEAGQIRKQGDVIAGRQIASTGSQGVTAGSVAGQVAQTEAAAASDALMAKYNGVSKAFGFKMESLGEETKAKMAELSGATEVGGTLATGGLQAIEGGLGDYLNFQRAQSRGFAMGMR